MSDTESATLHPATMRVIHVLETIAAGPHSFTLSDLSVQLGIPKSTLSPILHTLEVKGYITADIRHRYSIGTAAGRLGQDFLKQVSFPDEAEKVLHSITDTCKETCHFGILSGGDILYLRKIDSPQPIRMVSSVGSTLPAYSTAIGKSLLIDLSEEELRSLYPEGLHAVTKNTITDLDALYRQLVKAREEGFTYEVEESSEFIRCIGTPIRKNGKCAAAVSVAVPTFRYDEEKADLIRLLLKDASEKIEALLSILDIHLNTMI